MTQIDQVRTESGSAASPETGSTTEQTPAPPLFDVTPEPGSVQAASPWRSRKEIIAKLSTRVVEEQKAIHVLQALRWDPGVEEAFRQCKGRELPRIDVD